VYRLALKSYLEVYRISRAELVELARPFPIASSVIRWAAFRLALIRTMVSVKRELRRQQEEEEYKTRRRGALGGPARTGTGAVDAWKNLFDLQHAPSDAKALAVQLARTPEQRPNFNPGDVDERPSLREIKISLDALREDVAAIRERDASRCSMLDANHAAIDPRTSELARSRTMSLLPMAVAAIEARRSRSRSHE
jgi:hypothetical protein